MITKKSESDGIIPQEIYDRYSNLTKSQIDALMQLADRKAETSSYEHRKRIKAIRNTILGIIGGGTIGGVAGLMLGKNPSLSERISGDVMGKSKRRSGGIGGVSGAIIGGILANKLDKINSDYMESAGFDPTVPGIKILQDKAEKAAAHLNKKAFDTPLINKKPDRSFRNFAGELLGAAGTNNIAATVAGAAIPAVLKGISKGRIKIDPFDGATLGFLGSGAADIAGAITALVKARRNKKQQLSYDSKGHFLSNLLIPGVGNYNLFKRIGRIIGSASE